MPRLAPTAATTVRFDEMRGRYLRHIQVALLSGACATAVSACGPSCGLQTWTRTATTAQITEVTEGTGAPTLNGCRVVCTRLDGSGTVVPPADGGFLDAAAVLLSDSYESCSLAGFELTCVRRVCVL